MRHSLTLLLAAALLLLCAAPAAAEWGACDDCHHGPASQPPDGFEYGVCAHCHHVIDFGPQHDPDDPSLVCAHCHTSGDLHYVHLWEEACVECHVPTHIQGPHIYELYPTELYVSEILEIRGTNFGDTQGTSVIRLGKRRYRAANTNVLFWSNTQIRFRVPPFMLWPEGVSHTRRVWVRVGGVASNKLIVTITQP
jgi:hypothetical protein